MQFNPRKPVIVGDIKDFFNDPLGSTSRTLGRVQSGLFGWRADTTNVTEIHETESSASGMKMTGLIVAGIAIVGVAAMAMMKRKAR